MGRNSESEKYREISSFDELRRRKKEVEHEIRDKANNVSKSTQNLLEEGMKVVAVGFLAFVVSRLLNVFMSPRTSKKASGDVEKAFASNSGAGDESYAGNDRTESSSRDGHTEQTSSEHHNGHQSNLDTARIWLETISGGLEAAKIVLNQIAEVQEQAKQKAGADESTEKHTMDS